MPSPPFAIPPDTRSAGQSGHIGDHNNISNALQSLVSVSALNTVFAGGADPTGTNDSAPAFQAAVSTLPTGNGTGGSVTVPPGTYKLNSTTTLHENQWIVCQPGVIFKLGTTGIAAFNWTRANPIVFTGAFGEGGITGRPSIFGPGGTQNPSDGSIGIQMGDITRLFADVAGYNLQTILLLSNQLFFAEQGTYRVISQACKNPVIFQVSPTGPVTRTGSFNRTTLTVFHNDQLDGNYGLGGVQLLAGAQIGEGSVTQYGNWGGTGQAGVYALYISGTGPAGSGSAGQASSTIGVQLLHGLEYDGSGTQPGTIFTGSGNFIIDSAGLLAYNAFGGSSISTPGVAGFQFSGPIYQDGTLRKALWAIQTTGFPATWTGQVNRRLSDEGDAAFVNFAFVIPASTTITVGETLLTLPSGFFYPTDSMYFWLTYLPFGTVPATAAIQVNTSGSVLWAGATLTTPAGGSSFLYGQAIYPVVV